MGTWLGLYVDKKATMSDNEFQTDGPAAEKVCRLSNRLSRYTTSDADALVMR